MGQTINTTEARDLPIMGRNTYTLSSLATGMYTALNTTSQASGFGHPYDGASAQMSSEGIGSQYQIMLNGIPNAPEERASAAIYVGFVTSPDSVEEVTVQTHTYDAQYGHSSGTVVNAVLKGGANAQHGSLYEFFRNDKLNANSFAGNAASNPRGVMRWNQPVADPRFTPIARNADLYRGWFRHTRSAAAPLAENRPVAKRGPTGGGWR